MKLRTILYMLIVTAYSAVAQNQSVRFEHLTTKNGLSINRVTSIYKDKLGFMWFGTYWGLNRFDGFEFINYFNDPQLTGPKLGHNSVNWMADGPGDLMFILTGSGLTAFNIQTEQFEDISNILNSIPVDSGQITKIREDKDGNFWFICNGFGVFKMSPDGVITYLNEDSRVKFQNNPLVDDIVLEKDGSITLLQRNGRVVNLDVNSFEINEEWTLKGIIEPGYPLEFFKDSNSGYWVYAQNLSEGVLYFNNKNASPRLLNERQLGSNLISEILEDDMGNVVIATDHGGLTVVDLDDFAMVRHIHNPSDPTSLNHYGAISAYKDDEGTIWVGTNKGGISYYNPSATKFRYYKYQSSEFEVLNDINAVYLERDDYVWLGSDRGGLMTLNTKTRKFTQINKQYGTSVNDLVSNTVVCLEKDDGGIWIGTYHGGLSYFSKGRFTNYAELPGKYDLPGTSVWSLFIDKDKNLWVGTQREGVVVFSAEGNELAKVNMANGLVDSNYITSFDQDEDGNVWIGTGYGVYQYNLESGTARKFLSVDQGLKTLVNNSIESLYCDLNGSVWIGTQNGLSRYTLANETFENYNEKDGMASSYVVSIEEDNIGGLWFGTNKGITHFKNEEGQIIIRNFNESDGLQGELFNHQSSHKSSSGLMAFAGANGLNLFRPEDIQPETSTNRTVFTHLLVDNKQVNVGDVINDRQLLDRGLNQTTRIELKPFENSFSIGFAALNYRRPNKTAYRYILEGFNDTWRVTGTRGRRANYTNLDPGEYLFRVQSTNDFNDWTGDEISLKVVISTPWWKTPLAYLGYATLLLVILYIILRVRIDREKLKSEIENEKVQAKRLHELDLMKIRFFTNIGHEFRTPLTLILTPIERIIKTTQDPKFSTEYNVIQRNAKRLLTLVNQLLDFRKMEAGQHQLSLSGGDLVKFMHDIVDSFSDLSNENKIIISFESDYKEFLTKFDRDKMEKVMFNLFSNAFKFTQPGGKITLKLKCLEEHDDRHDVGITVSDTGIGIPKENLSHVFARFFQSDVPSNMMNHGSGIGLAITKEFVEMHKGTIAVESEVNQGSTFSISIPLVKTNIIEDQTDDVPLVINDLPDQSEEVLNSKKYTIILVEDNADFRFYLKDNLRQYFNIIEAENGQVGYDKIFKHQPDLVVSDVMMPVLNGIEMTTRLKKERKTRHIPIILLSSHQSDNHKIEGLQAGANDFISKPFNFEILESRIKSALSLKENIADSQKKIEVSPAEIAITSLDEKLIQKALTIVEENMSNADFSVQELSRELGVSRAQLYKKVVSITGLSPIEFIRDIRLKRAAALLEKSQLSVSEVAYKVGFNNPRYFSNYFKATYHVLPSKYVHDKKVENGVAE